MLGHSSRLNLTHLNRLPTVSGIINSRVGWKLLINAKTINWQPLATVLDGIALPSTSKSEISQFYTSTQHLSCVTIYKRKYNVDPIQRIKSSGHPEGTKSHFQEVNSNPKYGLVTNCYPKSVTKRHNLSFFLATHKITAPRNLVTEYITTVIRRSYSKSQDPCKPNTTNSENISNESSAYKSKDSCDSKTSVSDEYCSKLNYQQDSSKDQCEKPKYTDLCSLNKDDSQECCTKDSETTCSSVNDPYFESTLTEDSYLCPQPHCIYTPSEEDLRKTRFWRTMTLYVCLPLIIITSAYVYKTVQEERKKPRPPFVNAPYMYQRTKPFPWGDGNHTLFHNPRVNPIPPHGYEIDDPNEEKPAKQKIK